MITKISKKKPSIPVMLLSSIISCCVIFTTSHPFFSLLTGGRVLEGRNGLIQILFYSGYFLFISILIIALFSKNLEKILFHPYPLLCCLAAIPLAAHIYVGSFSRFVADDFSSASLTVNKGIIGATWDWYVNWSGRFSASFFDSLAGYFPPSWMKFAVGITLILLLGSVAALAYRVLNGPAGQRFYTGVFLSSIILTAAFFITPDLPQSLYWGQGMRSLILPLIPLFLQLCILYDLNATTGSPKRTFSLILLGILSFLAGGFGETYVVIQTTLFGLYLLFVLIQKYFFHQKFSVYPLILALFFSLFAMVVTIVAPGNHVRQAYFPPPPGIIELFRISFSSLGLFFQTVFQSSVDMWMLLFLLISSYISGWLYATHRNNSTILSNDEKSQSNVPSNNPINPVFLTLLGFCILLFVCFIPAAYGMSATPPGRTLILPSLILTVGISVISFVVGKMFHPFRLPNGDKALWLSLLTIVTVGFFSFQVSSVVLKVVPDYRFFANRFDRGDQLIREAKRNGSVSVKIPEVHNHFGLSDYGEGTTYWLDNVVDSYYGIHVIINKNMK
jgi:hypothetical protein